MSEVALRVILSSLLDLIQMHLQRVNHDERLPHSKGNK
jgi:hypothetical protein